MKQTSKDGDANASQEPSPPSGDGNEDVSQESTPPSAAGNESDNASENSSPPSTSANENASDGSAGSPPPSDTGSETGSHDSPGSSVRSDADEESEEKDIDEAIIELALASRRGEISDEEEKLPDPVPLTTGFSVLDDSDFKVATGGVVQICGPSGIGKTQLLYALVAFAIAPKPAGRAAHVRYFELSESVNVRRIKVLVTNLCKNALDCTKGALKKHVRKAMKRLVAYRVSSTMQLCTTLKSLTSFLETRAGLEGMFPVYALPTSAFFFGTCNLLEHFFFLSFCSGHDCN